MAKPNRRPNLERKIPRGDAYRLRGELRLQRPFVERFGKVISWIRFDPKTGNYSDGEYKYGFGTKSKWAYGGKTLELSLFRIYKRNRIRFATTPIFLVDPFADLSDLKAIHQSMSGVHSMEELKGKDVWLPILTIEAIKKDKPQTRVKHGRRGVLPAYMDFLRRAGAKSLVGMVEVPLLVAYHLALGSKIVEHVGSKTVGLGERDNALTEYWIVKNDLTNFKLEEWK